MRDIGEKRLAQLRHEISALQWPAERIRFIAVEGDSVDSTPQHLAAWSAQDERVSIVTYRTGKPKFGHIISPERFASLAAIFNAGLDTIDLQWSDAVLFTPGDVSLPAGLLTHLARHGADIVAPFNYQRGRFYDLWGFVDENGRQFEPFFQTEAMDIYGTQIIPMKSVGCTVLISAAVLRAGCRYTAEEVDRGLCASARRKGFAIWADPQSTVVHLC